MPREIGSDQYVPLRCAHCNAKLASPFAFCPHCGANQLDYQPDSRAPHDARAAAARGPASPASPGARGPAEPTWRPPLDESGGRFALYGGGSGAGGIEHPGYLGGTEPRRWVDTRWRAKVSHYAIPVLVAAALLFTAHAFFTRKSDSPDLPPQVASGAVADSGQGDGNGAAQVDQAYQGNQTYQGNPGYQAGLANQGGTPAQPVPQMQPNTNASSAPMQPDVAQAPAPATTNTINAPNATGVANAPPSTMAYASAPTVGTPTQPARMATQKSRTTSRVDADTARRIREATVAQRRSDEVRSRVAASLQSARINLDKNNLGSARAALMNVLAEDPNNAEALRMRGDLMDREQQRDSMLASARGCEAQGRWTCVWHNAGNALTIDSSNGEAHWLLSQALMRESERRQANNGIFTPDVGPREGENPAIGP